MRKQDGVCEVADIGGCWIEKSVIKKREYKVSNSLPWGLRALTPMLVVLAAASARLVELRQVALRTGFLAPVCVVYETILGPLSNSNLA